MPALSGGSQTRGVTAPRSLLESLLRSRQALRWNLPTPGDSDCGLSVVSPDRVPTQVLLPPAGFPACTVRLYNIGGWGKKKRFNPKKTKSWKKNKEKQLVFKTYQ